MSIDPILQAPAVVKVHLATVLPAFAIGTWQIFHRFIPLTFFGVFGALWSMHRGDIRGHRNAMIGLYVGGLLLAGAFTLLPGRIMHQFFFG